MEQEDIDEMARNMRLLASMGYGPDAPTDASIWAGIPADIKQKVNDVFAKPRKRGGLFSENYLVPWAHAIMEERNKAAARAVAEITRSAETLRPAELAHLVARVIIKGK